VGGETGELVAFDSCGDLESYLKAQSLRAADFSGLGGDYDPNGFLSGFAAGAPAYPASPQ
jgi:hypothetical protein